MNDHQWTLALRAVRDVRRRLAPAAAPWRGLGPGPGPAAQHSGQCQPQRHTAEAGRHRSVGRRMGQPGQSGESAPQLAPQARGHVQNRTEVRGKSVVVADGGNRGDRAVHPVAARTGFKTNSAAHDVSTTTLRRTAMPPPRAHLETYHAAGRLEPSGMSNHPERQHPTADQPAGQSHSPGPQYGFVRHEARSAFTGRELPVDLGPAPFN